MAVPKAMKMQEWQKELEGKAEKFSNLEGVKELGRAIDNQGGVVKGLAKISPGLRKLARELNEKNIGDEHNKSVIYAAFARGAEIEKIDQKQVIDLSLALRDHRELLKANLGRDK